MPFIVAYMGDPARHYRCAMPKYREYFDLTPIWKNCRGKGFMRLKQYKKHRVKEVKGLVYVADAF